MSASLGPSDPSPSPDDLGDDVPSSSAPVERAPAGGYGRRAVRAAVVLMGARIGSRLIGLARLIFVASVLGAEDMGVFAVAVAALAMLEVFTETGIHKAVIQRDGDVRPFLRTAFSIQLMRGAILGPLLFFSAEGIAAWFKTPEATPLLQWVALVPVIRSFQGLGLAQFERELHAGKLTIIELGSAIIDVGLSIILVRMNPDPMALVWSRLASVSFVAVVPYVLGAWVVRPGFEGARARALLGFGIWVYVSAIAGFLVTRGGDFAVGRILNAAALGVYVIAFQVSNLPTLEMSSIVLRVTFPTYARLQGDIPRLAAAFCKSFLVVTTAAFGMAMLIVAGAQDFVAAFLPGDQWWEAAGLIRLLAVWGVCRALGAANSSLFMAVGKPGLAARYQLLMVAMFAILVFPMISQAGLWGAGVMLGAVGVTAQALRYRLLAKVLEIPAWRVYHRTLGPLGAAAIGVGAGLASAEGLSSVWEGAGPIARLAAIGVGASAAYGLSLLVWDRMTRVDLVKTACQMVPARLRPSGRWARMMGV